MNAVVETGQERALRLTARRGLQPVPAVAAPGESDNLEQSQEMKDLPVIPETWEQDSATRQWAF